MLSNSFYVPQCLRSLTESSNVYEFHYVDPRGVQLEFPKNPRNLVFIYLESMENTLLRQKQPFNLQLLTVDTHFPNGWLDPSCPRPYPDQYDNVWSCASGMVAEFVSWIQKQPGAENTTIIVDGDHLGMSTEYIDKKVTSPDYDRAVFNLFINSAANPTLTERVSTSFDIYPSTLAAMGVQIPGERLALGMNLFSSEPTLAEQYDGAAEFDAELKKRSAHYERNILVAPKE